MRLVLGSLITIKNNNFNKKSKWLELKREVTGDQAGDRTGGHGRSSGRSTGRSREITGDQTGGHGRSREHKIAHHMAQTPFFHVFWVASSRGDLRLVLGSLITIKNNNFNKKSRWLELCGWCLGAQLQLKTTILIRNRGGWSSAAGAWELNYN